MPRKRNMTPDEFKIWFFSNVLVTGDCWCWNGAWDKDDYGQVSIAGKQHKAHRVAFALHHGTIDEALLVCHTCDNPPCINPAHLFQGTQHDNVVDCIEKGRGYIGRANPGAIYTQDSIDALKVEYAKGGHTYESAGALFGMSKSQAFLHITGKRYKR